jgi:tRNA(adenine34) deaminase
MLLRSIKMLIAVVLLLMIIMNQSSEGLIFISKKEDVVFRKMTTSESSVLGMLPPTRSFSMNTPLYSQSATSSSSSNSSSITPTKSQSDFIESNVTSQQSAYFKQHIYFMNLAIQEAQRAQQQGEVPIGALVVQKQKQQQDQLQNQKHPEDVQRGKSVVVFDEDNNIQIIQLNSNDTDDGLDLGDTTKNMQIFSSSFRILSRARNSVEQKQDASAHAELIALRTAARTINNWRLQDCILYTTLEPCPMCLAAAQAFRIDEIVYGAPDLRLGAVQTYMKLLDDYQHPYHTISSVVPGVLEDTSAGLLRDFFRSRRKQTKQQQPQPQQQHEHIQREWLKSVSIFMIVVKKLLMFPISLWKGLKGRIKSERRSTR